MTKPDIEIIRHSPGRTTVLVDGRPLPGVRTVGYEETAREAPQVTVTLVANRVTVRAAEPSEYPEYPKKILGDWVSEA